MTKIIDRLLAAILGLAFLAAGVLAAIEIVLGLLGQPAWIVPQDRWYGTLTTSDWTTTWLRTAASIACAAGVILIMLQFVRRRPAGLQVRSPQLSLRAWVGRRSVERSLERAARDIDGIASAKARVRSNRVIVYAMARRRDTSGLLPRVQQAVQDRIEVIELQQPPRLSVRVQGRDAQ